MKRLFASVLAFLLVLSLAPLAALPASAAEKVVGRMVSNFFVSSLQIVILLSPSTPYNSRNVLIR